ERSRVAAPLRRNELSDERLARRPDEREAHADGERAQSEVQDRDLLGHHERAEHGERGSGHALPERDDASLRPAVGECAAERSEREHRKALPEDHRADRAVRARELERDHAVHDRRHEEREKRGQRAEPEHAERRDREGREGLIGPAPQRGHRAAVRAQSIHARILLGFPTAPFCENQGRPTRRWSMKTLIVERDERGVVSVELNRPEKKNAISYTMFEELLEVFSEVSRSDADRVLVLSGAGGNFSAGADLGSGDAPDRHQLAHMRFYGSVALALHQLPQPAIAKI